MNRRELNGPPLSPVQRLENVYEAFIDDEFYANMQVSEEDTAIAVDITRNAIRQVLGPAAAQAFKPKENPASQLGFHSKPKAKSQKPEPQKSESQWLAIAQKYGLEPTLAATLTVITVFYFFFVIGSLGVFIVAVIPIAPLVGIVTWVVQMKSFGDSGKSAFLKGCAVTVLVAIPIPVAPPAFITAGILGGVWLKARRAR